MNTTRVDEAAAAWVAREDAGALDAGESAALEAWLAGDPRHAGAYARARAIFAQADRACALGPDFDPRRFAPATGGQPRLQRWIAAAAAILVLAVGSLSLLPSGGDDYRTMVGEIRRLPLPDGSVMTLNTDSRAEVFLSGKLRRIHLLRGEALFDVAHDPARPFVVESGDARVRAVGTSFSVRRLAGDGAEVVVREGRVRLDAAGAGKVAAPVLLDANQRAVAAAGRPVRVERIAETKVQQSLSWRDGMLAFDGDTLAEAALEFARYDDTRLRIDDPAVARMRVVGLYAANDPDGFARAVALSLGLDYERIDDEVLLRRKRHD
jgi:transmembrane sensor